MFIEALSVCIHSNGLIFVQEKLKVALYVQKAALHFMAGIESLLTQKTNIFLSFFSFCVFSTQIFIDLT